MRKEKRTYILSVKEVVVHKFALTISFAEKYLEGVFRSLRKMMLC
jgi:hypothetical protein